MTTPCPVLHGDAATAAALTLFLLVAYPAAFAVDGPKFYEMMMREVRR